MRLKLQTNGTALQKYPAKSEENFIALKDLNVDEIAEELIKIYKLNEEIT